MTTLDYPPGILNQAQNGDIDGAITALVRRIEKSALDIPSLDLLGLLYLRIGQSDQALTTLRRAARASVCHPLVHYHCAQVAEFLGLEWEAIAHYRKAWESTRDLEIGSAFAMQLRRQNELEESITVLRQLIVLYPDERRLFPALKSVLQDLDVAIHRHGFRNHQPVLFVSLTHSAGAYIADELARRA